MTTTELQKKLKQMVNEDQKIRSSFPKKPADIDRLNSEHTDIIKEIIAEFGVIDSERFGEETARNASLIIQHSTHELRKKYISMQEKLPLQKIYKRGFAYMKDRVLVEENKPQLYGTQMKVLNKEGDLAFNPINDFSNIDNRRKEIGLEPFQEYLLVVKKNTGKTPSILEQNNPDTQ